MLRAKLEIAAACHAFAKTPSHCVVTELTDMGVVAEAARRAARELGYTRMWSIHPSQIRTIVAAFLPGGRRDRRGGGDPLGGRRRPTGRRSATPAILHDRASYRYFWRLLVRARSAGARAARSGDTALLRRPGGGSGLTPGRAGVTQFPRLP